MFDPPLPHQGAYVICERPLTRNIQKLLTFIQINVFESRTIQGNSLDYHIINIANVTLPVTPWITTIHKIRPSQT